MKNSASKQLDLFADTPRVVRPKDPRLDEALLLKELADTRREVRNLTVMVMRPDVSADEREVIHNLERSARAQVKMGIKALQYCGVQPKSCSEEGETYRSRSGPTRSITSTLLSIMSRRLASFSWPIASAGTPTRSSLRKKLIIWVALAGPMG